MGINLSEEIDSTRRGVMFTCVSPHHVTLVKAGMGEQCRTCLLVGKHGKMQLTKNSVGGHHIDPGNLAACDGELGDIA